MTHCDVERLSESTGDDLADELESDMDADIARYKAQMLEQAQAGLKTWLESAKEKMAHLSEEAKVQALHLLYHRYMDDTMLALIQASAAIAAVDHMSISGFIHLTAEVYETELSNSVFGKLFNQQQHQQSEHLNTVAKNSTGADN